jgi:hypothetical protein
MALANWRFQQRFTWGEAFHRHGFDSGANAIPEEIEEVLRQAGCSQVTFAWGGSRWNHHIAALALPDGAIVRFDGKTIDPKLALPAAIVEALTARFGPPGESLEWTEARRQVR